MKKYSFLVAIVFLLISFTVKSQEKWSVEFRPGLIFPTSDVGNIDSDIGFGFEVTGAYKLMPHLAVYAGWGRNQFKGEDVYSKDKIDFDESGYTFGFQIFRQISTSPFSYVGNVGTIYNHIKLDNADAGMTTDTGFGFGWQVGVGIDYEFAPNLSFRPMLRYRSLARNVEIDNLSSDLKLHYISFGIGLAWEF